jgi:hypothetical protein
MFIGIEQERETAAHFRYSLTETYGNVHKYRDGRLGICASPAV